MVLYHGIYDVSLLGIAGIDPLAGGWWLLARSTLVLFLLVAGMSDGLAREKYGPMSRERWHKALRRCGIISAAALLVMMATALTDPETMVLFGVLHLLAVASLLLPIVDRLPLPITMGCAMICLVIGFFLQQTSSSIALLLPLGIIPTGTVSVDYVPLLPWLGVLLLGRCLSPSRLRHPPLQAVWLQPFSWLGRHALAIYLLHQPILLAGLMLLR